MKPIELLKDELNKYEKALQKSFIAFREGGIDSTTHETHKKNLEPKIFEYKRVINIIEQWQ
jgi:hypothetical protein